MKPQQNIKINYKKDYPVQHISAEKARPLRYQVLRPGQPLENSHYKEDHLVTTFHLGVAVDDKIICNGTFIKEACTYFPEETEAYRLRGMATDPQFQGRQLGSHLLQTAEDILRIKNCKILWFNARETAFRFYEKNGFQSVGETFDIPYVGPHKVMYKILC